MNNDDMMLALQTELSAMLDPLDVPNDWTPNQVSDYEARRQRLAARIHTIRTATTTLAERDAQIQHLTDWKAELAGWRAVLVDELLAMPPRVYTDKERGRRHNLELSITTIDRGLPADTGYDLTTLRLGELMRESGYVETGADPSRNASGVLPWRGHEKEVDRTIKHLTTRREALLAQLDEALLDDATREQMAAESSARRDALRALPTRKTRGDGSQYDRYPDGRVVEVEVSA